MGKYVPARKKLLFGWVFFNINCSLTQSFKYKFVLCLLLCVCSLWTDTAKKIPFCTSNTFRIESIFSCNFKGQLSDSFELWRCYFTERNSLGDGSL